MHDAVVSVTMATVYVAKEMKLIYILMDVGKRS